MSFVKTRLISFTLGKDYGIIKGIRRRFMKIIHTGDIHIGSALRSLPPEKAEIRKREIFEGFAALTCYAKENGVSAVIIAGDLFDENGVAPHWKKETLACIAAASPVRFFYVSGNHDSDVMFLGELPQNLFIFSHDHGWYSYDVGENVTITGADARNFTQAFASPLHLLQNRYNIVTLHGEKDVPFSYFNDKNVDYLALGHIHKPMPKAEKLGYRGVYRYCGCPEARGFDEVGARGFFLLEIRSGRLVGEKFLSLAKRMVVELHVDITACQTYADVENAVLGSAAQISPDDIVKVVLCGNPCAELIKDTSLLCERLCQKFFFAKIEDISRPYINPRAFENDLTERGEFVREVGRYEMNEDFRAEVLEVGLKALGGEEIDL